VLHGVYYSVNSSIHVGFVVDKAALGQVYLRVLRFLLSILFRHCSTFAFIYMLLLHGRQKASTENNSKRNTIRYDTIIYIC